MTNKEAIEFIKTDISRLWNTPQNIEHKEALEMAIKALEQEPTLSVEDLISWAKERGINIQVVKSDNPDTFEKIFGELCENERALSEQGKCDTCKHYGVLSLDCGRCDDECSQYEPQQRTGHWKQTNDFFINKDGQFVYQFICSECKALTYFRKSHGEIIGTNTCPNCGAKMKEGE